ncbi:MAG: endolytic transglycosylase MltG [Lachnospiraceae bacterium]|nr:endolytic transglycosylase MltG [Lachnospiraceae bacterium]MEE1255113.1 endolytic transglycosylase MltG [Lachnospiraceae bacterium]
MVIKMDVKQLLGAIGAMLFKIILSAAVIIVAFKLAVSAYDFGFHLFADIPVDEVESGRTVNVTITENQDSMEVAKMLEKKGLIRDAKMFYIQEMLSDYKDMITAGSYELNTAMTVEEMLATICSSAEATEEIE